MSERGKQDTFRRDARVAQAGSWCPGERSPGPSNLSCVYLQRCI